jgi:hypothetical protein
MRSPGLLFINIFPENTLDDDIESTKEDSLRHSLSDEVGVNFDTQWSRPSGIRRVDLVVEYAQLFHETVNFFTCVVTFDATAKCTDGEATVKVQTEKPVTGPMRSIAKGEMHFQRYIAFEVFWSIEINNTVVVLRIMDI